METFEVCFKEPVNVPRNPIPFSQFIRYPPKTIFEYLGRECRLFLIDRSTVEGYLFSVDPELHNILLVSIKLVGTDSNDSQRTNTEFENRPKPSENEKRENSGVKISKSFFVFAHSILHIEFLSDIPCPINLDRSDNFAEIVLHPETKESIIEKPSV